jgi:quinoprotein glucose dehydrogenase
MSASRCRAIALLAFALLACREKLEIDHTGPVAGWAHYGNDPGGSKYSPLTQISPANVHALEVAWEFHTGDVADGERIPGKSAFEATPILMDGALYFCSPFNRVFALDAETGEQRWVYDPKIDREGVWTQTCRGVSAWVDPRAPRDATCSRRIFGATIDGRLFALDAATGLPCADFGQGGVIDLKRGVGDPQPGEYGVTSPPVVIGDVVATGSLVGDGDRVNGPSGVVRAFDARTGALRWAFDPVPPGTPPLEPAADGSPRFHPGTPNAWSILVADPERDLLFVPFGGPSPDFYGGHRKQFDHFGSSVVALRGSSGERVWHFQAIHHDVWDYDVASPPLLFELERDGEKIPALAQGTKVGHLFVLHRETGEPLFPVQERPVPQGGVPGETLSPTQPFPTFPPPLHPHTFGAQDAWGFTPWDRGACREKIGKLRAEGIFTPPSEQGTVIYPGVAGGMNWGGAGWDPLRRMIVVPINRTAIINAAVPRAQREAYERTAREEGWFLGFMPQEGTPYLAGSSILLSPIGAPCTPPPWGTLVGIDMAGEEIAWEVSLGSTRKRAPWPLWFEWGTPHMGGPLLTASGLIFIAATGDDRFRAFDTETGEVLWEVDLPASAQATPMTYRLRADGRQFVVIAAGGSGSMRTTPGDSLLAFALPER